MEYLHDPRRADPRLLMKGCKSILVLAARYPDINTAVQKEPFQGRIAAYATVEDYHIVLPHKMRQICDFIEQEVNQPIAYRMYTDTGPLLEKEFAQRAGLGWIGKNTCLINPDIGSTFFLCEILLDIELTPDTPFSTDRCGTCRRCMDACPTTCILPDRTIDASRCISYLTIENKGDIPLELRSKIGEWVFGCDICQEACPWNNRGERLDSCQFPAFSEVPTRDLEAELSLSSQEFNRKYKKSPILRARRGGHLRNICVVLGNRRNPASLPALELAMQEADEIIKKHARWALEKIRY